ncbi:MAG: sulfotransferase [Cyanobacteria bacterium P01_A01_bin.83]
MKLPNFFLIGAQKAGTTSLCRYLQEHPQIYISPVAEPGFFAFEGEELKFSGPGADRLIKSIVTDLNSYCKLFEGAKDETALGEGTTLYLQNTKAPERIKHYVQDAKIIVILRNPVDRAFSAFMHLKRDDLEKIEVENFSEALMQEDERIQKNWGYLWRYKNMGLYSAALKRYFEHFPAKQIRVYLYEEFNNHPRETLADIFKFLDVDDQFSPELLIRYNVSGIPKSRALYNLMKKENYLRKFLKTLIPSKTGKTIASYIRNNNMQQKPSLNVKTRKKVLELFREDIIELQEIIQRDLSAWLD